VMGPRNLGTLGPVGRKHTWHEGSWGPYVGFHGSINYGNGYFGSGFSGGHREGSPQERRT
jgi:hypothetical protein